MDNICSFELNKPVLFFHPKEVQKSIIVSHYTYDKDEPEETINISDDSDSFEVNFDYSNEFSTDTKQNLKGFLPPRKIKYRNQAVKEFSLSDSEYGSLKNEKCSNKRNIVRKICDSTTDLQAIPSKLLKEMSPEPKITTTYQDLSRNNCESSSDYTYLNSYIREKRTIPFKKRYIHNCHAKVNSDEEELNQYTLTESESSSTSSSSTDQINEPDISEQIESRNKVKAWKADFQSAYNNDYDDFNEERCLQLEEKINEDKTQYENKLLEIQESISLKRKNSLQRQFKKLHFMHEYCTECNAYAQLKLDENNFRQKKHIFCNHYPVKTKIHRQLNPVLSLTSSERDKDEKCLNKDESNNSTNYFSNNLENNLTTTSGSKIGTNRKRRKKFSDIPLSPETTKRNEFYSYLQISAKPRMRSDGTPMEPNRRSVRVKNIEIIKERDRSLSEELKSVKNEKRSSDKNAKVLKQVKLDIKKIFAKPKLHTSKRGRKMRKRSENVSNVEKNLNSESISVSCIDSIDHDEFGFSPADKKLSLDSQNKLALAIADIDSSLRLIRNSQIKRDENPKVATYEVEEKSKKIRKQQRNITLPLNHINGPVTRHSNAVINKTLTRSSHTKIPKLNLDAVMKRMYHKQKINNLNIGRITKKTKRTKSSKENTCVKRTVTVSETIHHVSFNDTLLNRRKDVSNILNAVNSEVLKVQSNILELSTQKSFYGDNFSDCSRVSEHSFHGFGIQSHISISTSTSTSEIPVKLSNQSSSTAQIRVLQRRVSLPTYINNQRELNLQDLLAPDDNCNVEPSISTKNSLIIDTPEQSPKFIPLSPNTSIKPIHTIFTKRNFKLNMNLSCQFGLESMDSSQFENYCPFSTGETSTLRESIREKLQIKQTKLLNSTDDAFSSKNKQHCINLTNIDGAVLNINFVNSILIVIQENCISFWQQTPLGTILGAQNMWLSLGKVQRLKMGTEYLQLSTLSQSYLYTETATAYIELWTKEHKSEKRERPITDIFATVYFYNRKGNSLEKKVIQLENIKGFAQDVQYVSLKFGRSIVVSWRDQFSSPPRSQIRKFKFAIDFQTVSNVMEIESVEHYIAALRDAKECSEMVLGIGDLQISVWHLAQGKLITSVAISNSRSPGTQGMNCLSPYYDINCVWALCDRGFLFLLNKTENNSLQLIAINGLLKDWKSLQVYKIPSEYSDIQNVIVDGGILSAYSKRGVICWSVQSGAILLQCPLGPNISLYSCDSHILLVDQYLNIQIKSILLFLLED